MEKRIKLTKALIDQILFAMEDQGRSYDFSLSGRTVQVHSPRKDDERVYPHPFLVLLRWVQDAWQLHPFTLNNPLAKSELSEIQESGQGVFRKFKGYLRRNPGLYRNWLRFKRKFMLGVIQQWAEEWEEYFEVADLGDPAEELDDLVQSDFDFSHQDNDTTPERNLEGFYPGYRALDPRAAHWEPKATSAGAAPSTGRRLLGSGPVFKRIVNRPSYGSGG
jgi:hypothetical protein